MKKSTLSKSDRFASFFNFNLILILSLVFIDFISKFIVRKFNVHYLFINYVQNSGIAFGLFKGYNLIFTVLALCFLIFLIFYIFKLKEFNLGLNLLFAGALGNLIDRLLYGFVIDFIDLKYWYIFNFADAFVVIGALIILFKMIKQTRR